MSYLNEPDAVAPDCLLQARVMVHNAVQIAALAALANLKPKPDYSHTSLDWDAGARVFQTKPISGLDGQIRIGVSLTPLTMRVTNDDHVVDTLNLDTIVVADCLTWLDALLETSGLQPVSGVRHPFKLPADVSGISQFDTASLDRALKTLESWFALADRQLQKFAALHADITPGPSAVTCWPHHFDMATYVSLDTSGGHDAPGIGIGMSPGDKAYAEPYFYVNPWPHLDAASLPQPPVHGHWHTAGFVGAIATASALLSVDDMDGGLQQFIEQAFQIGRELLGPAGE